MRRLYRQGGTWLYNMPGALADGLRLFWRGRSPVKRVLAIAGADGVHRHIEVFLFPQGCRGETEKAAHGIFRPDCRPVHLTSEWGAPLGCWSGIGIMIFQRGLPSHWWGLGAYLVFRAGAVRCRVWELDGAAKVTF